MIDIHSHILPGVDDGAKALENSIEMAGEAVKEGITHLYATPHHRNGRFENEKDSIVKQVAHLNQVLLNRGIPLNLIAGQEIRLYKDLIEDLDRDLLVTLHNNVNYLLVELPSSNVPNYAADIFYELSLRNYHPIIVHPERNSEIMENPDLLYTFISNGALTQVTASSIIGNFGKKIMHFSQDLIKSNMAHFIASDAHNVTSRGFHLTQAYETIQNQFGMDTRYYLQENAELVLKGESILIEPPSHIKKKKFLGIF
jgi:protein-tyrosine phosphatase